MASKACIETRHKVIPPFRRRFRVEEYEEALQRSLVEELMVMPQEYDPLAIPKDQHDLVHGAFVEQ